MTRVDTSTETTPSPAAPAGVTSIAVVSWQEPPDQPIYSNAPSPEVAAEQKYLSTVGHYKLIKAVESDGSASRNYQCVDTRNNKLLECKVLKPDKFAILQAAAKRLSADRLQDSSNPIVARLFPIESSFIRGQIANTNEFQYYWFYEESYGDLHSYVRDSKGLEELEARLFFRQIIETVVFCHSRGIILRDIKLRKFVFANKEKTRLRLSSLDDIVVLAKETDDTLSIRHGCPAYVAPELLVRGPVRYSGRHSDTWSCGILLFVMFIGRYPYHDPNATVLFRKIIRDRLFVPTRAARGYRMPTELLVLINGILRKTPEERPTALDILAHPWLTPKRRYGYGTAPRIHYTAKGVAIKLIERCDKIIPCLKNGEQEPMEVEGPASASSDAGKQLAQAKAMVAQAEVENADRCVDYDCSDCVPNIDVDD